MPKNLTRVPDVKPITIGHFTLTETGVDITGRPSFGEYQGALDFALRAQKASSWWVADLLRYAGTREDWNERIEAATDAAHISEKTAMNLKYVGENVARSRRRGDIDFSLHSEVASLPAEDQGEWLEKAATEGWSVRDLRLNIRAAKRRKVIEGQAVLEGLYRVIYADPPWAYGRAAGHTSAQDHYSGMTIDELCKLPVAAHSCVNAVLFLWVTAPMLYESPGPREVIEAWGFTPKAGIVWDKVRHNFGNYVSVRHEHLIIATRGSCTPDRPTPMPDSVITERPTGEHSAKPESFRRLIEQLYDGPYLELFARTAPPSPWVGFGNDARLWAEHVGEEVGV